MKSNTLALDAERSVLGGILLDCNNLKPGLDLLRPNDFAANQHRVIFEAMLSLQDHQQPIDVVTVEGAINGIEAPKDGWRCYLTALESEVPTSANVEHYAEIVRRESRRRDFVRVMSSTIEHAREPGSDGDELLTQAVIELGRIAENRALIRPVPMTECVRDEMKAIQTRQAGDITGLPSGFESLDRLTGGMSPGYLVVIAARPSMGKSALAGNVIQRLVIGQQKTALLFSLEMSRQEQAQRFLAAEARVDLRLIRGGGLSDDAHRRLATAANKLFTSRLSIVDTPALPVSELRSVARQLAARQKLDLIVVDYLQLMKGRGDNREQEIASMTRGLKALAMELRIPVIAMSQLSRAVEGRQEKRPTLPDLRESGAIEQDADQVIFIYRDEYYNKSTTDAGIAEISVGKNRNGPTGTIKLRWTGKFTRFDSLGEDDQTNLFDDDQEERDDQ